MFTEVAVLVHGYTLLASQYRLDKRELGNREWRYVVAGAPDSRLVGRIPHGIKVAEKYSAKKVIFGTGASCIFRNRAISRREWEVLGCPPDVTWEAEVSFRMALEEHCRSPDTKEYIEKCSLIDLESVDTKTEISRALSYCHENGIGCLISVTSISHIPRCAALASDEVRLQPNLDVLYAVSACDTDFSESSSTIILEPQSGPRS